jgi:hypothetical protein
LALTTGDAAELATEDTGALAAGDMAELATGGLVGLAGRGASTRGTMSGTNATSVNVSNLNVQDEVMRNLRLLKRCAAGAPPRPYGRHSPRAFQCPAISISPHAEYSRILVARPSRVKASGLITRAIFKAKACEKI